MVSGGGQHKRTDAGARAEVAPERWIAARATSRPREVELILAWMGLSAHPRDPTIFVAPLSRIADRYTQGIGELERVHLRQSLQLTFVDAVDVPERGDLDAAFRDGASSPPTESGEVLRPPTTPARRPSGAVSAIQFRTIEESSGVPYAERAESILRPDRGTALNALSRFAESPGMPLTVRLWFAHDLAPAGEVRADDLVDACAKAELLPGRVVMEAEAPQSPVAIPLWESRLVKLRQRGVRIALRHAGGDASPPDWLRDVPFDYLYAMATPSDEKAFDQLLGWFDSLRRPKLRLVLGGIGSHAQLRLASSATHALRAGEAVGRLRRL